MRIGVLALQGAFAEHLAVLARLGVDGFEIRERADLNGGIDGLILPGGESTVMGRLLRETGLFGPLKEFIQRGLPVFGTCAGMILLARRIENDPVVHFGTMDITEAKRLRTATRQLPHGGGVPRYRQDPDDLHPRAHHRG